MQTDGPAVRGARAQGEFGIAAAAPGVGTTERVRLVHGCAVSRAAAPKQCALALLDADAEPATVISATAAASAATASCLPYANVTFAAAGQCDQSCSWHLPRSARA